MQERRGALGGSLPRRLVRPRHLRLAAQSAYEDMKKGSGKQAVATTMAFVRLLKDLMKDREFGKRFVPIIPDEARTFGLDSIFRREDLQPERPAVRPVDRELLLSYREAKNGQILHEGISEAGAMGSFTAAGTAYAAHGEPMIPIYIFYSMFGFQRTGDAIWAAADQMARGFMLGATAGAPRWPVRGCSTTTATRCCSPRPTRPSWRTTRRGRTRRRPRRSGARRRTRTSA